MTRHAHQCPSCKRMWFHVIPGDLVCRNYRAKRGTGPSTMKCIACGLKRSGGPQQQGSPPPKRTDEEMKQENARILFEFLRNLSK